MCLRASCRQQLQNWGLTKHTAFTCAWQYLFPVPQQGVAVRAQSISQRLRTSPALKIGLQVRLGDFELARSKAWDEGLAAAYLNAAKRHIDCAEQIEARWATEYPGRPIQWFVISDSRNLRIALKNKYGTKIVTDDESMPQHVDCNNPLSKCKTAKNMQQAAMILAVADIITMSMTDAQVHTCFSICLMVINDLTYFCCALSGSFRADLASLQCRLYLCKVASGELGGGWLIAKKRFFRFR